MSRWKLPLAIACCAVAAVLRPDCATAQLPTADLSRIHPPAARVGETLAVSIAGTNLEDVSELRFSHPEIVAEPVMVPADDFLPERPQANHFEVTVGGSVPPGIYEVRAIGFFGISTSRPFLVAAADSNEVTESGDHSEADTAMPVELNSVVFGSATAGRVDWYRIHVPADERILVELQAERIDSRLDGLLKLYGADGREIAQAQDHFGRDPLLEINSPVEADYLLAVSDILYRGSADHFYRLHVLHNRPLIDFVVPPAGQPGSKGRYTIYGRNLPGGRLSDVSLSDGTALETVEVEIELPGEAATPAGYHPGTPRQGLLPGFDFSYQGSNSFRIGYSTAPVVAEDASRETQHVTLPVEVAGRFDLATDEDVYRFVAEKDRTYAVEVTAERMAVAVDPYIVIHRVGRKSDGSEELIKVAENDDMTSFFSIAGMESINADTKDSAVVFKAEEGGEYAVTVVNLFGSGGAELLYRLAIREPVPDFGLIATTEHPLPTNRTGYSVTPHLRRGASWAIRIVAPRQDNFAGDIIVTAEGLPDGVTADPLVLGGTVNEGKLIISASDTAAPWSGVIRIVGRTTVGDREVVRNARFAALIWGHVFADSIRVRSRLTTEIPLSVNGFERAPVIIEATNKEPLSVEIGQEIDLPIRVADSGSRKGGLTVTVDGLYGIHRSPPSVNVAEAGGDAVLKINFNKTGNFDVAAGRYQFTLKGVGTTRYHHNLPASERAVEELKRVEALLQAAQTDAELTKKAVATALATSKAAEENLFKADEASKAELEKKVAEAKQAVETAQNAAKAAADKVARGDKAKAEAERLAKAAESRSKESTEKFAAWSKLVTVIVTEPAKK